MAEVNDTFSASSSGGGGGTGGITSGTLNSRISELLKDLRIESGRLVADRYDNENQISLVLPTGTAVADGVVVLAVLDAATRIATITTRRENDDGTTTDSEISLDLTALARADDVPDGAAIVNLLTDLTGEGRLSYNALKDTPAIPTVPDFATTAQAEAGEDETTVMSPARTSEAIAALASSGGGGGGTDSTNLYAHRNIINAGDMAIVAHDTTSFVADGVTAGNFSFSYSPTNNVVRFRAWDDQTITGGNRAGLTEKFFFAGNLLLYATDGTDIILRRYFQVDTGDGFGTPVLATEFVRHLDASEDAFVPMAAFDTFRDAEDPFLFLDGYVHRSYFELMVVSASSNPLGTPETTTDTGTLTFSIRDGGVEFFAFNEALSGRLDSVETGPSIDGDGSADDALDVDGPETTKLLLGNFDEGISAAANHDYTVADSNPASSAWRTVSTGTLVTLTEAQYTTGEAIRGDVQFVQSRTAGGAAIAYRVRFRNGPTVLQSVHLDGDDVEREATEDFLIPLPATNANLVITWQFQIRQVGNSAGQMRLSAIDLHHGDGSASAAVRAEVTRDTQGLSDRLTVVEDLPATQPWAQVGGTNSNIPSADLDDPFPRNFVGLNDTPGAIVANAPVVGASDATGLVFGTFPEGGGGGGGLELLGSSNIDVLTDMALIDTGLAIGDHDLYYVSLGEAGGAREQFQGAWATGTTLRGLGARTAGSSWKGLHVIQLNLASRSITVGRSAANTLLIGLQYSFNDPMPLSFYGLSGGGGSGGGASTYDALTDTEGKGTAGQIPRTSLGADTLEPTDPDVIVNPLIDARVPAVFRSGNTDTIDPAKLPSQVGDAEMVEVMATTWQSSGTATSRGFAADFILPEDGGIFEIIFESASSINDLHAATTIFDAAIIRELDALTSSGNPPTSTEDLTTANAYTVRISEDVDGNPATSLAFSRDATDRLLIRPTRSQFAASPANVSVRQLRVNVVVGASDSTGGGATGQADSDAANNFDVITGPNIVRTWTTSSLTAASDGSLVLAPLFGDGDPANVPIVSGGNVLKLRFEGQTVTGPELDLYWILPDGTYITTGEQFPRTGEILELTPGTSLSNGTAWRLAYGLPGFTDVTITGGTVTATVIRYHEVFSALTEESPVASLLPAGWRYAFSRPINTTAYKSFWFRLSNNGRSIHWFELPTGSGDVNTLATLEPASFPTDPGSVNVYAMLHAVGQPPAVLRHTRAYPSQSYLTFVFERDGNGNIVAIKGIGDASYGIGWDADNDIKFQLFAELR